MELINNFWRLNKEHYFTAYEAQVYFKLLDTCNSIGWKNPFNQSNLFICAECGISEPKLIQVRNKLKQVGLIDFESGKAKRSPSNYLILFSRNDSISGSINGSITDSTSDEKRLDNIKLINKTKLNKKSKPKKEFEKPKVEDVVAYCVENGYPAELGTKAHAYYDAGEWKDSRGNIVVNWKQKLQSVWFKPENKISPKGGSLPTFEPSSYQNTNGIIL